MRWRKLFLLVSIVSASPASAAPLWNVEKIDRSANGNRQMGMKVTEDGRVHIAYTGCSDSSCKNNELFYGVRDSQGGWTAQSLDAEKGDTGWFPSLAIDESGSIQIAYTNHYKVEPILRLASKATNSDWKRRTLAKTNGGYWTSIGTYRNELFISNTAFPLHDINKPALEIATGNLSTGAWTFDQLDSSPNAGWFTSLAVGPDGLPAIAYVSEGYPLGNLNFARKTASGNWITEQIDDDTVKSSVAIDPQGFAHIAYNRLSTEYMTVKELWYATNSPDGQWKLSLVDGRQYREADTGYFPSLKLDAKGGVHIAYEDNFHLRVMYARNIGKGWETYPITKTKQDGYYTWLELDSKGGAHVAYDTGYELRYAYCRDCANN